MRTSRRLTLAAALVLATAGITLAPQAAGAATRIDLTTTGSNGNDVICADSGSDKIYGLGGDDTIYGENGNDRIFPGVGDDTVDGGAGQDFVDYGDVTGGGINVNMPGNVVTGAADTDTLAGIEHARGTGKADTLSGDDGNNRLVGNKGNDIISGGNGADRLMGGYGVDQLDADDGAGTDVLDGGKGPTGAIDVCLINDGDVATGCEYMPGGDGGL